MFTRFLIGSNHNDPCIHRTGRVVKTSIGIESWVCCCSSEEVQSEFAVLKTASMDIMPIASTWNCRKLGHTINKMYPF